MLLTTNSAITNHSSQYFCLWLTKNHKYCSSSWFILSVWPSVCEWNDVDNFISISNILFNFFINSTANYGLLSKITLSGNLYNFHILSLNSLAKSSTDILSVITIKYVILDNLSYTIRIISFPTTNSNFVMKYTIRYVHSFSDTSLNFNFPLILLSDSSSFDINHNYSYIFLHFLSLPATSNSSLLTLLSSTFLYTLPLVHHDATR